MIKARFVKNDCSKCGHFNVCRYTYDFINLNETIWANMIEEETKPAIFHINSECDEFIPMETLETGNDAQKTSPIIGNN